MTTTMNASNGRPQRKSLAGQLDRLDETLDGLSDSLNEAVACAVKDALGAAVREAVQAVLTEVLTNPDVLARLRAAAAPAAAAPTAPKKPGAWQKLKQRCQSVREAIAGLRTACGLGLQRVRSAAVSLWRNATTRVTGALTVTSRLARQFKWQLLTALGVGLALGLAGWFGGPLVSAVTSGVGGFGSALAVQAGLFLRKLFA